MMLKLKPIFAAVIGNANIPAPMDVPATIITPPTNLFRNIKNFKF
jgi:hypothetical protein